MDFSLVLTFKTLIHSTLSAPVLSITYKALVTNLHRGKELTLRIPFNPIILPRVPPQFALMKMNVLYKGSGDGN